MKSPKQKLRCSWATGNPNDPADPKYALMQQYHDEEWGVPLRDSRALWELLMLEGFQAGLSWSIILRKREAFRKAFKNFDPAKVARFTQADIDRLMQDEGIVRARAKIEATIAGAKIYMEMQRSGEPFADFLWNLAGNHPHQGTGLSFPVTSPLSETMSKELKKRGFKFVGPVIVYAFLQASGIVNDHATTCFRRKAVKQ